MAELVERQVARERERFLSSGGVPSRVRAEISSSWRRCRSWSVPADGFALPYRPDLDPESPLLRAARPVLDSLVERLGDLQISVLLTDADARIVDRRVRERSLLGLLDARKIVPGFVFAEDVAGTNGLGTAIELGRTTRIDGHEHYASDLVGFTCVGVPITDPIRRRCIGILDVTCAADPANRLVTLVAEQTARAIESRLMAQHSRREQALLARFLATSRSGHGGVVVVGERVVMTNPPAARLLEGIDQTLLWDGAARAAAGAAWAELTLADGRVARTRTTPLHDGGELVGALIELRPVDEVARERQPPALRARPTRADPVPERPGTERMRSAPSMSPATTAVVGSDPAFLAAVRAVRGARAGQVLVLCGEPGAGKRELAMDRDPAAREVDASAAALDGEQAWLAALAGVLGGPPEVLVVRHLELLTPGALRTVSALLGTATARGRRCTATSSEASVLPGVDHEHVWLPPLRRRLGDVPALVAAFAAPVVVAPEVVQLLQRLAWPGNVRELRAAVRRIVDATPAGARAGPAAVPADIRCAATRRTLSRFERAEVHAILDALTETGGNKKDAAALLGISRSTLYRKLQTAGIDLENTVY